jgi:proteasome accessory factor B
MTLAAAIHFSKLRHVADCNALLSQSIRKLLAESPKHVQHSVGRLMRSCGLGDHNECLVTHGSPIVRHVLSAIALRRKLSIKVAGDHPGSAIETRLAPYQMIASSDAWQVVGLSSRHRSVRTFDARQLTEPNLTNQAYAIPRGYQAALS